MFNILSFFLGGIIFDIAIAVIYYLIQFYRKKLREKYTPQRATNFKCLDDHVIRSKGELIIVNHLTRLNIAHEYENTINIKGSPDQI